MSSSRPFIARASNSGDNNNDSGTKSNHWLLKRIVGTTTHPKTLGRIAGGAALALGAVATASKRLEYHEDRVQARDALDWVDVHEKCANGLKLSGLDCCASTTLQRYNEAAPDAARIGLNTTDTETSSNVHDDDDHGGECMMMVVGNSKALWSAFEEELRRNPEATVDEYVRERVQDAIRNALVECVADKKGCAMDVEDAIKNRVRVFWATDMAAGKIVAIQRLAHVAGLAYLDETTHQSVHPNFGPWCAFRAAIVFDDVAGPEEDELPRALKCPVSEENIANAKGAFDAALENWQATSGSDPEQWRMWLAARDAMCGGKFEDERYSEDQILWHYAVDRDAVRDRILRGKAK